MNPLYSMMGGNNNLMQMLNQLRGNPAQLFARMGLNIPQNIANDPNAIINYLAQSGKINQNQINQAYQTARQMGLIK